MTEINASAAALTREQQLWVRKLMLKPEWVYPEVLLWIVHRDAEKVAGAINFGDSALLWESATTVATTCRLIAQGGDAEEEEPADALEVALLAGDVQAVGDWPDRSNYSPIPLEAADWQYLKFFNNGRWQGSGNVIDSRRYPGPLGLKVNVRFSRESVTSAFPPTLAPKPSAAPLKDVRPYNHPDRLTWAAREQRAVQGDKYRGATALGIARAFAVAELGSAATSAELEREADRIRKAIGPLDWKDLERLSNTVLDKKT